MADDPLGEMTARHPTVTGELPAARSASSVRPADLGLDALAQLVESSRDGIALLDDKLCVIYMNPAGCEIVGYPLEHLIGGSGLLMVPQDRQEETRATLVERMRGRPRGATATIVRADGQEREIEYTGMAFEVAGRTVLAGSFRDCTEARRSERWASALASIASSVTLDSSLEQTLDALAESVVEAAGLLACSIFLFENDPVQSRLAGTSGLPADYAHHYQAALRSGLDLPAVRSFQTQRRITVHRSDGGPACDALAEVDKGVGWSSIVCIPMIARGRSVGVVKGFFGPAHPPDPPRVEFLATMADQATMAVENARLFANATQYSRRQEILLQAGLALASELSLPAVLQKIVELATEVAEAGYGALGVMGSDGQLTNFITTGDDDAARAAIGHIPIGEGILAVLMTDVSPVRLRQMEDDTRSDGAPSSRPSTTSFLGVPVTVRGRVYGNLYLTDKRGAPEFTEEDERAVVTLAAQAAVAIENARLFDEGQQRRALEERHRLARDLHDSVSQALFSMTLQTRAAELALEKESIDPDGRVGQRLRDLQALTDGALSEMRMLILELRPGAIQEEGLVPSIRKLAQGIEARDGLCVEVEGPSERLGLAPEAEEQLYRLTQEALNNAVRHADARRLQILVHVSEDLDELSLEITDDGVGFDPALRRPGHLGLRSMEDRATAAGGRLDISSRPGEGTRIRVDVPLSTTAPKAHAEAQTLARQTSPCGPRRGRPSF